MQRQHCYSYILHLTSDRKPLIWPNAIKISRDIQIQQPGVFFSCCLTAVNTSSLQLVSCWLYFRHLFPMLPDSPIDSKKHFSCFFIHSCYITVLPLFCTEGSVQRLALTFYFSVLVFLHESSIKMHDHMNVLHENTTHATESLLLSIFTNTDALKQINSLCSTVVSIDFSFLQVYKHKKG